MSTFNIQFDKVSICPFYSAIKKWDGIQWCFYADWNCNIKTEKYEFKLLVKAGFKTDGGSIPQVFQNIINPLGKYLYAFLVHDALYASEYCTRAGADWILLELCEYLGASWIRRNEIYSAVRVGGGAVWLTHTKKSISSSRKFVEFTPIGGFIL
jgi:hypothetical protein